MSESRTTSLRAPRPEAMELIDADRVGDLLTSTEQRLRDLEEEANRTVAAAADAEGAAEKVEADPASTTWTLVRLQRFITDLRNEAVRDAETIIEVARQHANIRVDEARLMAERGIDPSTVELEARRRVPPPTVVPDPPTAPVPPAPIVVQAPVPPAPAPGAASPVMPVVPVVAVPPTALVPPTAPVPPVAPVAAPPAPPVAASPVAPVIPAAVVAAAAMPAAAPVAVDDAYEVRVGETLVVAAAGVLANDQNPSGGPVSAVKKTDPALGTLSAFGANGAFTFVAPSSVPAPAFGLAEAWRNDASGQIVNTFPVVGDVNGDGYPDLVLSSQFVGHRAVDLRTGATLWDIDRTGYADCGFGFATTTAPALADVDDDGVPEYIGNLGSCERDSNILAAGYAPADRIFALDGRTGAVKWMSERVSRPLGDVLAPGAPPSTEDRFQHVYAGAQYASMHVARLAPGAAPTILFRQTLRADAGYYQPVTGPARSTGCRALTGLAADDNVACRATILMRGDGTIESILTAPNPSNLSQASWDPTRELAPFTVDVDGDGAPEIVSGSDVWKKVGGVWTLLNSYDVLKEKGPRRVFPLTVPMLMPNGPAAAISLELGARAGTHTPVSACASGAEAMAYGVDMIRTGRADIVVCGGTEAAVHPLPIAGFAAMQALSTRNDDPEAASRPYDAGRDGFVLGEGAGIVVLESEAHARARGAKVYAEIAGAGLTSDAHHIAAPDPEGTGAARAMRAALEAGGLSAADVVHLNAHATSTPVGDLAELHAIRGALGADAEHVAISATKSMTGHLLGAAGALEGIFTVLALHHRLAPPTINLDDPDPAVDLDVVRKDPRPLPDGDIAALNNSFGFGGHNVAVAFKSV